MPRDKKVLYFVLSFVLLGLIFIATFYYFSVLKNKTTNIINNQTNNTVDGFQKPLNQEADFCQKNDCTIALVIKKENYTALNSEISVWKNDVEKETKNKVEIKTYENNVTKETIKNDLKDLYQSKNLRGVVLVGNIPYAKSGFHCSDYPSQTTPCLDYKTETTTSAGDPFTEAAAPAEPFVEENLRLNDYFYTDIDNKCGRNQAADAFYYDSCSQDSIDQPFWISRLTPPLHETTEANKLLKDYFTKNHNFRSGQVTFEEKLLVYTPLNKEDSKESQQNAKNDFLAFFKEKILSPYKLEDIKFIDSSADSDTTYFNELKNRYEMVYYNGHGATNFQQQNITPELVISSAPNSLFYEFMSCSVGRYSVENYLAGTYLFNTNALMVLAATTPIFGVINQADHELYQALASGWTIGDTSKYKDFGAVSILGDGTLRMRYKSLDLSNSPEINIDRNELDFGQISLNIPDQKKSFNIKNDGKTPLTIYFESNVVSRIFPLNAASVVAIDNNNGVAGEITIAPSETKEIFFNVNGGGYDPAKESGPYVGKFTGFLYISTNDLRNPIVKLPYKGEVTK